MPTVNNNQREGAVSNAHVGRDFEEVALLFYKNNGIDLTLNKEIEIGISQRKIHKFDLGNDALIVECKSYKWTNGNKVPGAKIHALNEAMFYFYLAPIEYQKHLFILMNYSQKHCRSLVEYYVDKYYFFIPRDVEIYEYYEIDQRCVIYKYNEKEGKHIKIS